MPINLKKGQTLNLHTSNNKPVDRLYLGLGWDPKKGLFGAAKSIDLDASLIMFSNGQVFDAVWYGNLTSKDGSTRHHGDNLTGEGEGDDEIITIDLARVSPVVDTMVVTVNSFSGQTFSSVANASCHLVDQSSGDNDMGTLKLSEGGGKHTAVIMAAIRRQPNGLWAIKMIGEYAHGKQYHDLVNVASRHAVASW